MGEWCSSETIGGCSVEGPREPELFSPEKKKAAPVVARLPPAFLVVFFLRFAKFCWVGKHVTVNYEIDELTNPRHYETDELTIPRPTTQPKKN